MEYVKLEGNWLWQEIDRTREEFKEYPQWIQDEINGASKGPQMTVKLPWRPGGARGGGMPEVFYDRVIVFLAPDPAEPYTGSWSMGELRLDLDEQHQPTEWREVHSWMPSDDLEATLPAEGEGE